MPTNHPTEIPSPVDDWDYLLSTTLYAYKAKFEDNIFDKTPILNFLKGGVETEDGGFTIVRPVMHTGAFDADVAFFEMYDAVNPTEDTQGFSALEYRWRQHVGSLAISGLERHRNKGRHQAINLLRAKVEQLEMTIADEWNTALYADPASNSKAFNGLAAVVSTADPTRAALGGKAVATNAWWVSKENTVTEALSTTRMSNLYNSCSLQNESPDRIFTTQALWEKYESLLQPQLRYSDAKVADAGFQNLIFKSTPIVWDPDCQANTMYFLNSKYIKLVKNGDVWLKHTPFFTRHDRDQENRYAQIVSYGELICTNRSKLGKLTNKS